MFDITALKQSTDLRELAAQHTTLIAKTKTESAGPCPICQGTDRFVVQANRWLCRHCTGGQWRDIVYYGALLWDLDTKKDFREICERLNAPQSFSPSLKAAPALPDDGPPPQEWQDRAAVVVEKCSKWLWDSQFKHIRDYLSARGLHEETLKRFQIGYNPSNQTIEGHYVAAGILIPHLSGPYLWGVKIRKNSNVPGHKYTSISGSKQNLFNAGSLQGQQTAFVVEGEFDAMLLDQAAGDLAAVITLGSATGTLGGRWLPALLPVERFLIATDNDQPGREAKAKWQNLTGARGQSVDIPQGKDITEYWQSGGNVRLWAMAQLGGVCPWVDPDVARAVLTVAAAYPDVWPVTLYNDGQPVIFLNAQELQAATNKKR
jgi:phage/plasmid primase-like uncharacterized protein